jgi:glycosyltransferase involved in cell wall biosynthesis
MADSPRVTIERARLGPPRGADGQAPALVFVGAFVDPDAAPDDPAYSAAGTLMQQRLLASLRDAGLAAEEVIALRTAVSFPRSRRLLFGFRRATLPGGIAASLLPFINVPPLKQLSSGLAVFALLTRWARRRKRTPRAILLYNVACPPAVFSLLAGRFTGSKVFAVVADLQVPGSGYLDDTLLRRCDYWLQHSSLRRFDGLIALTDRMASDHAPAVPAIRMEGAVPPELETGDTASDESESAGRPFTLMYAGELSELKGLPLLLSAFARLEGPGYRLWITGKGELRAALEAAATRDPRIVYRGFPPYEQVLDLYRRADVLVNPHSTRHLSARYLFPSKLLEYLATGTPVISTPCTPEVGQEYGDVLVLMREESTDELVAAVRRVETMPAEERRALGQAARRLVLERKTWRAQGARIAGLIRGGTAADDAAVGHNADGR